MKKHIKTAIAILLSLVMFFNTSELTFLVSSAEESTQEAVLEPVATLSESVCMDPETEFKTGDVSQSDIYAEEGSLGTIGLGVTYHTQEEIEAYLAESGAKITDEVTYATQPSTTAPYRPGELSDETKRSAIAMFNQVRYIAGLSYDVTLNEEYNELCQAASLVCYANGALSHYPTQPADMDDDLFQLGYSGAGQSNIAYASWQTRPLNETLIHGWMADDNDSNLSTLGHRRWVLNPPMKQTGFGAVKGSKGIYSAMYAFDSFSQSGIKGVAWPAQTMPADYFAAGYPWSVSVGETVDISAVKVILTRESDGKKWTFSEASSDGYFNVNNDYYGQRGCIIFRPNTSDITSYKDGDVYHVEITNNGQDYVSYDVNFFEPAKTYKITYHLNGGVNHEENPQTYKSNSETFVLKDPSKEGYLFAGWYSDSKFTKKITQINKGSKGDLNLYAKWRERNFDIPFIATTSVTVNSKRVDGVDVSVYAAYGNAILDVTAQNPDFVVKPIRDEAMEEIIGVNISPVKELPNGSYQVDLNFVTENTAEDNSYSKRINVKVANKAPKLVVKQSATFNYFYKNEMQRFFVSSADGSILSAQLQEESDFLGFDQGDGQLCVVRKDTENTGKPSAKVVVEARVTGYRDPVEKKVTIAMTKKAPKITLNRARTTFSTLVPEDASSPLSFTDKTRGEIITGKDVVLATSDYVKINTDCSLQPSIINGKLGGKTKSAKITFEIQKDNWVSPVKVSHVINVVSVPIIKPAKKSVTLNGVYKTSELVPFELSSQSLFQDCQIEWQIKPSGNPSKSAFLEANIASGSAMMFGFKDDSDVAIKAGTYKYLLSAVIKKGEDTYSVKPVALTVKVNNKEQLTVSTSAKGSIDVLQRQKPITYTINGITNSGYDTSKLRGAIRSVELEDLNQDSVNDKFAAVLRVNENNKPEVVVTAKEDSALSTQKTYLFRLKFHVEGLGVVYSKKLSIKPKQSAVKTAVTGEMALYPNYLNGKRAVQIKIVKPEGVMVDTCAVQQDTIPKGIAIYDNEIVVAGDTITIPYHMTEDAPTCLKAKGVHTMKVAVAPKGMGIDKKTQNVSVKFVVK